jgi:ATP-dependent DNA helicase PIF1
MTITELKAGLNDKQSRFVDEVLKGGNICLTGPAGVGKSHVVAKLKKYFEANDKPVGITALTGCAAINIGGATIHSWAGIGLGEGTNSEVFENANRNKKARGRIQACQYLLIDEISMAKGELLDKIDYVFKHIRHTSKPFGGIQIIAVGDFYQLPPIFKGDQEGKLAFESKAWADAKLKVIELTEIVRQSEDKEFARFLSQLRKGESESLSFLNPCVDRVFSKEQQPVKLYCRNINVEKENEFKLNQIHGETKTFNAIDYGGPHHIEYFNKNCPAPKYLKLKVGAQVMLLKNLDVEHGYCNGSIGIVMGFLNGGVEVKFQYGRLIVSRESWEIKEQVVNATGKMVSRAVAERSQIPLKLAWAMTVHKAQGATLDCAEVDIADAFATGQIYVALSRVRNSKGLSIKPFSLDKIKVNDKVAKFLDETLRDVRE